MEAGEEREALAALAARLCSEFGYPSGAEIADEVESLLGENGGAPFGALLSPGEERTVAAARRALAEIAAALETRHPKVVSETTYRALLDGAEMVIRTELAAGKPVAKLMPSAVFLIALPMVDREEALELCECASALLDKP